MATNPNQYRYYNSKCITSTWSINKNKSNRLNKWKIKIYKIIFLYNEKLVFVFMLFRYYNLPVGDHDQFQCLIVCAQNICFLYKTGTNLTFDGWKKVCTYFFVPCNIWWPYARVSSYTTKKTMNVDLNNIELYTLNSGIMQMLSISWYIYTLKLIQHIQLLVVSLYTMKRNV